MIITLEEILSRGYLQSGDELPFGSNMDKGFDEYVRVLFPRNEVEDTWNLGRSVATRMPVARFGGNGNFRVSALCYKTTDYITIDNEYVIENECPLSSINHSIKNDPQDYVLFARQGFSKGSSESHPSTIFLGIYHIDDEKSLATGFETLKKISDVLYVDTNSEGEVVYMGKYRGMIVAEDMVSSEMVKCEIETEPPFNQAFLEGKGLGAPSTESEIVSQEIELSMSDYIALKEFFSERECHQIQFLAPHLYNAIHTTFSDKDGFDDYIITGVRKV